MTLRVSSMLSMIEAGERNPMYPIPSIELENMRAGVEAAQAFANSYGRDSDLRSRVAADPRTILAEHGLEIPPGSELRILMNTDDTFHFVFPPDPNVALSDEMLDHAAGGKTVSSAGSAACASTAGCATGTVSSGGSASTASSIGSAAQGSGSS